MSKPPSLKHFLAILLLGLLAPVITSEWYSPLIGLSAGEPLVRDDSTETQIKQRYFENRVRPLLEERCIRCHGPAIGKQESGLDLSHREGLLKGGRRGAAVLPGKPDESLLIQMIEGHVSGLSMPPDDPLSAEERKILRKWIEDGLVDPRLATDSHAGGGIDGIPPMEKRGDHWSFQPLTDPVVPKVGNPQQIRQALDAFILSTLEEKGWGFAPEADLFTRAKRASHLVTGLPLDWDRWQILLSQNDEEAFDEFIEELLESDAFGERWARWWLDLARYSDSNGLDENLAFGEAWRYRDYVIRSFNQDKPYDRFLLEQLAGDLLPEPTSEQEWRDQRIATGFLALGPKMLAEQDKDKLAIDVVDEQLDVTGQVFMGMTIGCARCHDHKFDPVTARDYYAMAGIFRSTSSFENLDFVSRWREVSLETPNEKKVREDWEQRRSQVEDRRNKNLDVVKKDFEKDLISKLDKQLVEAVEWASVIPGKTVVENSSMSLGLNRSMYGNEAIPLAHTVQGGEQQVTWDLEVLQEGLHEIQVRYTALESRPMKLYLNGEVLVEAALGETTGTWGLEGLRWQSVGSFEFKAGVQQFKLVGGSAVPHLDRIRLLPKKEPDAQDWEQGVLAWVDYLQRPSTLEDPLWGAWAHRALKRSSEPVHRQQEDFLGSDRRQHLAPEVLQILGESIGGTLGEISSLWKTLLIRAEEGGDSKALVEVLNKVRGVSGPWYEILENSAQHAPPQLRVELDNDQKKLQELDQIKPQEAPRTLGVQDSDAVNLPIHIRGSHLRLEKEPTPRGVMSVIANNFSPPSIPDDSSGRLEFAQWLLHPEHPLTARVIVNRVWLELFGEGLVSSPSNFGLRGDSPSHPELLDRLARDFIADGWSIKRLIRKILDSTAWRQQVVSRPEYMLEDPENRLLWSQNRQRLRAEAVRDSVLQVSGQLDRKMGGTLLMTPNRGYVTNDQSNNQARYDLPRRSIYLPVIRNAMYELFSAFDYNDPSIHIARRPSTVVAHQALYFLNSPMVIEAAGMVVDEVLKETEDENARIDACYRRILCRHATESELERASSYFEKVRQWRSDLEAPDEISDQQVWHSFCQTLLASSEFLYLD